MKIQKAFTLAEVLITLGIIGVVAAMTLPTLISHYRTQASVERLKKAYSIIHQAYKFSELENGDVINWDWNLSHKDFFDKYFIPYIKITKNCGDNEGCWSKDGVIHYLNGNNAEIIKSGEYAKVELIDGTYLALQNQIDHAHFYVDTNGSSSPNMHGKDIFLITFTNKALKENNLHDIDKAGVWMYATGLAESNYKNNCKANEHGTYCGAWLYSNSWKIPQNYPRY